MEPYILTGVGIIVSVALFLITYRQTIGAKKERIAAANAALERALLRRIVQEAYRPTPQEIEILIDGFAREHRVKDTDLMSTEDTLNMLYTRIASTDLIHSDQRGELLERIMHGIAMFEGAPIQMQQANLEEAQERWTRMTWLSMVSLGVIASLVGSLIAAYPLLKSRSPSSLRELFGSSAVFIFAGSLGIIFIVIFLLRLRERSEEPSKQTGLQRAVDFEQEVARTLRKYRAKATMPANDLGYDFELAESGKRILLQVKAWGQKVPLAFQRQTIDRLRKAIERSGADEAWIIVRDRSVIPHDVDDERIRFLTLDQLRKRVSHGGLK